MAYEHDPFTTDDNDPMQIGEIATELEVWDSGARWLIDTGRLPAQRTAHGQRIARRGDVLRYKRLGATQSLRSVVSE